MFSSLIASSCSDLSEQESRALLPGRLPIPADPPAWVLPRSFLERICTLKPKAGCFCTDTAFSNMQKAPAASVNLPVFANYFQNIGSVARYYHVFFFSPGENAFKRRVIKIWLL